MKKLLKLGLFILTCSCQPTLSREGRIRPYAQSTFFDNESSARAWPEGVVPRNSPSDEEPALTSESLKRGQQVFNIYCQVCHGLDGKGGGMAVLRGFPHPPDLHEERLREMPLQHFYDVQTAGFGRMFSYANRIPTPDRWAVAQYVRALQVQQHFPRSALSPQDFDKGVKK
jgi:mono/diheme cytochrome c family protein